MFQIIPLGLLGLGAGILINYLADVLPRTRRISTPTCFHCEKPVPFRYYFIWPQKCPNCGRTNNRRVRSWLVLLVAIGAAIWLWNSPPEDLGFPLSLLIAGYFILIVVVDVEHRLILIPTVLAGVILGAAAGIRMHGLLPTIYGGLAGYLFMFLLYKFGEVFARLIFRLRGNPVDEVALGFGDVNLSGVLGLILGWPAILIGLILAILIGGIAGFLYMAVKVVMRSYRSFEAMPYAPYLISATALILFFPDLIRNLFAGFATLFGPGFL